MAAEVEDTVSFREFNHRWTRMDTDGDRKEDTNYTNFHKFLTWGSRENGKGQNHS
jgi:hypothetical protein